MATEEFIISLDARTARLESKLQSATEQIDRLSKKTKQGDSGLKKFGGAAQVAGDVVLKTAAAATALASAISAIVIASANNRRELELLSKQAKTSAEDFQALAFATSRYGINADQIADISKDIADKVGEFSAAGTGAFQDYADVMKLSKDEAREAAQEFEGLSSQEILGRMVSRMEDASVSGDKMTFVLESLGNDASRLIPLFKGNSDQLNELKKRFNDVNDSLQITGTQAEALREVSNTFTLLTSTAGNATTAISATLAPVMNKFFNDVIEIVPDATQTIIDFVNSFLDAENITSIAAVNKEIADGSERIALLTEKQENSIGRMQKSHTIALETEKQRLIELEAQLAVLTEQEQKLENANRLEGGSIGGGSGFGGSGTGDELESIKDRFKTEEELLGEKLMNELEIIGQNDELKLELYREYAANLQEIKDEEREKEQERQEEEIENYERFLSDIKSAEDKAKKQKLDDAEDVAKAEQSISKKNVSSLMAITGALIGHDSKVGMALFLGSQALALSETFVNTQAAAIKALTIDPTGALSAKVTSAGYLSMAAIAATSLGSIAGGGGGGSSTMSSGGGSLNQQSAQQTQPDFLPETTRLQLSNSTDSGATNGTIRFATDSGDELMNTIAKLLNKGQQEGRFA